MRFLISAEQPVPPDAVFLPRMLAFVKNIRLPHAGGGKPVKVDLYSIFIKLFLLQTDVKTNNAEINKAQFATNKRLGYVRLLDQARLKHSEPAQQLLFSHLLRKLISTSLLPNPEKNDFWPHSHASPWPNSTIEAFVGNTLSHAELNRELASHVNCTSGDSLRLLATRMLDVLPQVAPCPPSDRRNIVAYHVRLYVCDGVLCASQRNNSTLRAVGMDNIMALVADLEDGGRTFGVGFRPRSLYEKLRN
jgi:hypothetical protein